jgi:hypothetical protein
MASTATTSDRSACGATTVHQSEIHGAVLKMAFGKTKNSRHILLGIIESKDLQRRYGMHESELRELAEQHHLPVQFSTLVGMYIHRRCLPWWDAAARK